MFLYVTTSAKEVMFSLVLFIYLLIYLFVYLCIYLFICLGKVFSYTLDCIYRIWSSIFLHFRRYC